MRRLLPLLLLALPSTASGTSERGLPVAEIGETHVRARLLPSRGRLVIDAALTLVPPPAMSGHSLVLHLRDDLELRLVSADSGYVEARQGGRRLTLFFDPPPVEPVRVSLSLEGIPALPRGDPLVTPELAFLPPGSAWYPFGRGTERFRLDVEVPEGWTVLGSGLGVGEEGRASFVAVDQPAGDAWLLAVPDLALRTVAEPVPLVLAGPADRPTLLGTGGDRISETLGALEELLGPLPGRSVVLAGVPGLDEPLSVPGALILPFEEFRDDMEGGGRSLAGLIGYWWGGLVRAEDGGDPRWLAGFAEGLAAELRRERQAGPPPSLARLEEEYWRLPADRHVPLKAARRRDSDAAVLVPAAGIFRSFAIHAGPERLGEAVSAATARYRGRAVSLRAFAEALEKGARFKPGTFFEPWLTRSGPASLSVTWNAAPVGRKWDLTIQMRQSGYPVPLPVEVVISGLRTGDGRPESLRRTLRVPDEFSAFPFRLGFEPQRVEADPDVRLFRWTGSRLEKAARADALRQAYALAEEARLALDAGQRDAARQALDEADLFDPAHPLARLQRGRLLLAEREVEASRALLVPLAQQALHEDYRGLGWVRAWAEVFIGRGWDLRRDRNQAIDAYRRALDLPDAHGAHRAAQRGVDAPDR